MPNGKNRISIGCEYGRLTRNMTEQIKIDVNKIGAKLDKIYVILISTLITMISSIFVGVLIYYITKGR